MTAHARRKGGGLVGFTWTGVALLASVAIACTSAESATGAAACASPEPGQALCGSCGSQCYYCATGTCPLDPCSDNACDGTSECSTVDSAHPTWSYCGFCTSSSQCTFCSPGTCSSNPCSAVCDSTGGYGPVGSSGSSSGGTTGSSSGVQGNGTVTTCGNCPGQIECSTIVGACVVQSCACFYVIDGSDGDSTWYLANGGCYMCQQNGLTTGDCSAAASAAAQAIVGCQ
jgi:hypothetical protein